jgi:hypothetical protein
MTPTENPASTSPTGDRHTAGWIGLAARRSLLALRLIADSERIVGNPSLIGKVRFACDLTAFRGTDEPKQPGFYLN